MNKPQEVKENHSWNQFCATGKIEDYLHYVSCRENQTDLAGDSPHAGVYRSNRNYTETDAYR